MVGMRQMGGFCDSEGRQPLRPPNAGIPTLETGTADRNPLDMTILIAPDVSGGNNVGAPYPL